MFSIYDTDMNSYPLSSIESYELIDGKKSGGSMIARAGIGFAVLGPVGLLAGATAKKKYKVLLLMKSGSKKVVTLKEKELKKLMESI